MEQQVTEVCEEERERIKFDFTLDGIEGMSVSGRGEYFYGMKAGQKGVFQVSRKAKVSYMGDITLQWRFAVSKKMVLKPTEHTKPTYLTLVLMEYRDLGAAEPVEIFAVRLSLHNLMGSQQKKLKIKVARGNDPGKCKNMSDTDRPVIRMTCSTKATSKEPITSPFSERLHPATPSVASLPVKRVSVESPPCCRMEVYQHPLIFRDFLAGGRDDDEQSPTPTPRASDSPSSFMQSPLELQLRVSSQSSTPRSSAGSRTEHPQDSGPLLDLQVSHLQQDRRSSSPLQDSPKLGSFRSSHASRHRRSSPGPGPDSIERSVSPAMSPRLNERPMPSSTELRKRAALNTPTASAWHAEVASTGRMEYVQDSCSTRSSPRPRTWGRSTDFSYGTVEGLQSRTPRSSPRTPGSVGSLRESPFQPLIFTERRYESPKEVRPYPGWETRSASNTSRHSASRRSPQASPRSLRRSSVSSDSKWRPPSLHLDAGSDDGMPTPTFTPHSPSGQPGKQRPSVYSYSPRNFPQEKHLGNPLEYDKTKRFISPLDTTVSSLVFAWVPGGTYGRVEKKRDVKLVNPVSSPRVGKRSVATEVDFVEPEYLRSKDVGTQFNGEPLVQCSFEVCSAMRLPMQEPSTRYPIMKFSGIASQSPMPRTKPPRIIHASHYVDARRGPPSVRSNPRHSYVYSSTHRSRIPLTPRKGNLLHKRHNLVNNWPPEA